LKCDSGGDAGEMRGSIDFTFLTAIIYKTVPPPVLVGVVE